MRVNAYVLAADPAWIEESIESYYDMVDRIILSYDETRTGWSGAPLDSTEAVDRALAVDRDKKMELAPGRFVVPGLKPLDRETGQRQNALDRASDAADWVLQLDSDEVLLAPNVFRRCLEEAHERAFDSMEYPSRRLFQHAGGERFVEGTRRFWRVAASYPGPVAVRAGSRLEHCRQGPRALYRVDFAARNTDPSHSPYTPVHRVVKRDEGIAHFSWVRDRALLRQKTETWGHADGDWTRTMTAWEAAGRHPYAFAVRRMGSRTKTYGGYRISTVPGVLSLESRQRNGLLD